MATQKDELIDTDKLASDFLEMHDKLGLRYDREPEALRRSKHMVRTAEKKGICQAYGGYEPVTNISIKFGSYHFCRIQ